jgi:hypothetical protein
VACPVEVQGAKRPWWPLSCILVVILFLVVFASAENFMIPFASLHLHVILNKLKYNFNLRLSLSATFLFVKSRRTRCWLSVSWRIHAPIPHLSLARYLCPFLVPRIHVLLLTQTHAHTPIPRNTDASDQIFRSACGTLYIFTQSDGEKEKCFCRRASIAICVKDS